MRNSKILKSMSAMVGIMRKVGQDWVYCLVALNWPMLFVLQWDCGCSVL